MNLQMSHPELDSGSRPCNINRFIRESVISVLITCQRETLNRVQGDAGVDSDSVIDGYSNVLKDLEYVSIYFYAYLFFYTLILSPRHFYFTRTLVMIKVV